MRLLTLSFGAIGPFASSHTINLEALGAHGLFLLEGPTGAGKTTIIDAIVFALYGDVSGEHSGKGRLVSTHRAPDAEPFAELTFETSHGIYRVRRTPEYERTKKRGTGITPTKATCRFYSLATRDSTPELISGNIAEANAELRRVVGLRKDQFTQTVVLPQGQFAEFLRARPDERRKLLQEIFGTQIFEDIQGQLQEMAAQHRKRVESARVAVEAAENRFASVACGPDTENTSADACGGSAPLARLAALETDVAQRRAREDAARQQHQAAGDALRREERLAALVLRRRGLRERRALLMSRAAAVDERRRELERADAAEALRTTWTAARRDADRASAAAATVDRLLRDAAQDPELAPWCELGSDQLSSVLADELGRWRRQAERLRPLAELEHGLPARTRDLEAARRRLATAVSSCRERQERLDAAAARTEEMDRELTRQRELASGRAEAEGAVRDAEDRVATHATAQEAHRRVADQEKRVAQARHDAARRLDAYRELHQRWVDATAGRLASELADGVGCPVCGSQQHPRPAQQGADDVDRPTVEAAHARFQQADRALAATQSSLEGERMTVADLVARIGPDTPESASAALRAAVEVRDAAKAADETGRKLEQDLRRARREHERDATDLAHAREQVVAVEAALRAEAQAVDSDAATLERAHGDWPSIVDAVSDLQQRVTTVEALIRALQADEMAREQRRQSTLDLTAEVTRAGFASLSDVEAAQRNELHREGLRVDVARHDDELTGVEAQLTDADFAHLAEDAAAAVAPAQEAAARARETYEDAVAAHARAAADYAAVKRAYVEWEDTVAQLARLDATSKPFVDMADLARGNNPRNINLATYVLLRRFEEIVDRANARLTLMTGGRYELVRTDESEGRERRTGLGLAVVDRASHDARRNPNTLSGGETFLTSLALALGLAEAVTAEAGGIELQTLFIDEGFGTLDPESLDLVMQQLARLRAGGRSVGIISHVAELKQQIGERVEVRRLPTGGSTLRTTAD